MQIRVSEVGVACLVVAGAIEYFSGGAATALAADVAYGGIGLIGSGISSWWYFVKYYRNFTL